MKLATKTISERSGTKVLLAALIGLVAGYVPEIVNLFDYPGVWEQLVPILSSFVVALLMLLREQLTDKSVAVKNLPASLTPVNPKSGLPIRK